MNGKKLDALGEFARQSDYLSLRPRTRASAKSRPGKLGVKISRGVLVAATF